jgi:hypothetical protein
MVEILLMHYDAQRLVMWAIYGHFLFHIMQYAGIAYFPKITLTILELFLKSIRMCWDFVQLLLKERRAVHLLHYRRGNWC